MTILYHIHQCRSTSVMKDFMLKYAIPGKGGVGLSVKVKDIVSKIKNATLLITVCS